VYRKEYDDQEFRAAQARGDQSSFTLLHFRRLWAFKMRTRILEAAAGLLIALPLLFLGCENQSPPIVLGGPYISVLVGGNSVMHERGTLRLYQVGPNNRRKLVWPALVIRNKAIFGDLIVFSGFLPDDGSRARGNYPALFAYAGTGSVMEVSESLAARNSALFEGITNISFTVVSSTNNIINFNANERPPFRSRVPMRKELSVSTEEMESIIAQAQKTGLHRTWQTAEFIIGTE
jgi:hypothetical protein